MNAPSIEVTCLGLLVADVVGHPIDSVPERGKLQLVDRIELHSGGCAANTGIGLAKLGVRTAVIGKVGNDGFGDFLVGRLEAHGIAADRIARDTEAATSATMVLVRSDGERDFLHYLGANATLSEDDIDFELVGRSRVLHYAGHALMPSLDGEPAGRALARAREMGVVTTLDTAWDDRGFWMERLRHVLPHCDYVLPSYEEARALTGRDRPDEIAASLRDHGAGAVGIKLGEEGCYLRSADQELHIPALPVLARDALGAGDAWVAGFLTGLVHGWDLERTGRFANAVGACCVQKLGATTGVRSLEETEAFLQCRI